ncbi:MAG: hypothetical protein NTV61_05645 [Candidatus Bathyarchaeota archaeon]|nr:hypothetical protein [Candidatus Bathyarchaeota archaeon]
MAYVFYVDCLVLPVDLVDDAGVADSDAVGVLVSLEFGRVVGVAGDGLLLEGEDEFP